MPEGRDHIYSISEVESDPVGVYVLCRAALAQLGINNPSVEDCSALRSVFSVSLYHRVADLGGDDLDPDLTLEKNRIQIQ